MKVISSNLPKGRFETCPYPVLLPLHGVVKANWHNIAASPTSSWTKILVLGNDTAV